MPNLERKIVWFLKYSGRYGERTRRLCSQDWVFWVGIEVMNRL